MARRFSSWSGTNIVNLLIYGREHIRILHAAQRLIHRPHQLPHQVR